MAKTSLSDSWAASLPVAPSPVSGFSEDMAVYDPRPSSVIEQAMTLEIDDILQRLHAGIPKLRQDIDDLLVRLREPELV
jgi:hypothetical protein